MNGFTNVRVFPHALCNKPSTKTLFSDVEGGGSSLYHRKHRAAHVDIVCTTLDSILYEEGWAPISMIKIDIEGGEVPALEGMTETCSRSANLHLIIELHPRLLSEVGVGVERFFTVLQRLGFSRFYVLEGGLNPVVIPKELSTITKYTGRRWVNLLCERG
jgi:hypothetical protein